MKWICLNIVSLTCILAAGTIAALGKDGWGWFLFVGACTAQTFKEVTTTKTK